MVNYYDLKELNFPNTPITVARHDELRKHIVSSSAYIKFALNESNIKYNKDSYAPFLTDATHELETGLTAEEYVEASRGEAVLAEELINNLLINMPNNIPVRIEDSETPESITDDFRGMRTELGYLTENLKIILNK